MALTTIPHNFGQGGSHLANGVLKNVLVELQGLTFSTVAGAAKTTDIAVAGIAVEDTVLYALALDPDNATAASQVLDVTSEVAVTEAGKVQLSTTNTTGYKIVLVYINKS